MMNHQHEKKKFYPDYLFEILIVTIITLEIVFLISILFPPGIGRQIDFNAMYQPLPEWYFLWIYELIKYFPGQWTFVGAVVIPLITFFFILLAPFLDRTPHRQLRKRPIATLMTSFLIVIVSLLTLISLYSI